MPSGRQVSAPVSWLAAAAITAVAAIAATPFAGGRPLVSLSGWIVGGFVAVGLVTVFVYRDSVARTNPWYVIKPQLSIFRTIVLVLATVAVALNAFMFADWFSRR